MCDRYDTVPDDLVLNNTLQIEYNSNNAPAGDVLYDMIETLNDTEFVPILRSEMAPADIEYRLDVYFDVSTSLFSLLFSLYDIYTCRDTDENGCRLMMMVSTVLLVSDPSSAIIVRTTLTIHKI